MIWEIDDAPKAIEGLDELGRPDPAYAASLGLVKAPFGRRVLATVLELIFVALLALPGALVLTPLALQLSAGTLDVDALLSRGDLVWLIVGAAASQVLVTAFTLVQLILHGRKGVTVGKAIVGIRSINVRTLERPGFWRGAVVRYLLMGASFVIPFIGPVLVIALSPLMDSERRGRSWLDLAAATWFVDVRGGLNPYDVKRMRVARKQVTATLHEKTEDLPSLATPNDRYAPAAYVPTARLSGGVLGAHRSGSEAPAAAPEVLGAPAAQVPDATPALTGSPIPSAPPAAAAVPTGLVSETPFGSSRASQSVASVPSVEPVSEAEPTGVRAVLILDSGERIEVRTTTLIGRAPSAAAGEGAVQLAPIADETRSVSKTHLAIMLSRRGIMVVDRGSTNGSSIVRDGVEGPLLPGHPIELYAADFVRFGDRSLRVEMS